MSRACPRFWRSEGSPTFAKSSSSRLPRAIMTIHPLRPSQTSAVEVAATLVSRHCGKRSSSAGVKGGALGHKRNPHQLIKPRVAEQTQCLRPPRFLAASTGEARPVTPSMVYNSSRSHDTMDSSHRHEMTFTIHGPKHHCELEQR